MTTAHRIFAAIAVLTLSASPTYAQLIYNFDAPNFTLGATTPLMNVPTNIGGPGLLTSFSSMPTASGFIVSNIALNPLFSGQMLYDPVMPADNLTITFDQLIFSISVDFGVNVPSMLQLTDGAFVESKPSAFIGPNFDFQGGTLIYSNPAGFSTIGLAAFDSSLVPVLFGIDNLVVTPVPEPGSLLLISTASLGVGSYYRRKWRGVRS